VQARVEAKGIGGKGPDADVPREAAEDNQPTRFEAPRIKRYVAIRWQIQIFLHRAWSKYLTSQQRQRTAEASCITQPHTHMTHCEI